MTDYFNSRRYAKGINETHLHQQKILHRVFCRQYLSNEFNGVAAGQV